MKRWTMATVERTYGFRATHHLPGAASKRARTPHNHIYNVTVFYKHEVNGRFGWTKDFWEVDEIMRPIVESFEGADLNLYLKVPTSELVCCMILNELPGWVDGVSVRENSQSKVTVARRDFNPKWWSEHGPK